ncbi:MAG: DUF3892 domain-containing protein [Thermoplasmata archaeon]
MRRAKCRLAKGSSFAHPPRQTIYPGIVLSANGHAMVFVESIDAPDSCPDCTAIQNLCLSNRERISRVDAYWRVKRGALIRSGSEQGPRLRAAEKEGTLYVRTEPNDSPNDNLLQLPRGC